MIPKLKEYHKKEAFPFKLFIDKKKAFPPVYTGSLKEMETTLYEAIIKLNEKTVL